MENRYPTLSRLLTLGLVWVEAGTYVGERTDGSTVDLGQVASPDRLERWLRENPTWDLVAQAA